MKIVMCGAIKEDLGVIGAVDVNITIKDGTNSAKSTRSLCYVSNSMERAFLRRKALISLGIIHADFPNVTMGVPANITAAMEN